MVLGLALSFPSSLRHKENRWVARLFLVLLLLLGLWATTFGYRALLGEYHLRLALQDEARLQIDEALNHYGRALDYQPERLELRNRLDALLKKMAGLRGLDNRARRQQNLQEALTHSPRDIPTVLRLADLYLEANRVDEATQLLAQAASHAPYHSLLERKRVAAFLRAGQFEQAARVYQPYLAGSVFRTEQMVATLSLAEVSQPGSGVKLLREWLADPDTRPAVDDLLQKTVETASRKQQWQLAQAFSKLHLSLDTQDLCRHLMAARIEGQLQNEKAEFTSLSRALQESQNPTGPCFEKVMARRAELGFTLNEPGPLQDQLEAVLKKNPRSEAARVALAEALYQKDDHQKALKTLRDGLDDYGISPGLLAKMGDLYERLGSLDLARGYYRDALRLSNDRDDLKRRLDGLDKKLKR